MGGSFRISVGHASRRLFPDPCRVGKAVLYLALAGVDRLFPEQECGDFGGSDAEQASGFIADESFVRFFARKDGNADVLRHTELEYTDVGRS